MVNEAVLDSVGPEHDVNGMESGVDIVMVLDGMEFVFLTVAGVLWFGFSIRLMLMAH